MESLSKTVWNWLNGFGIHLDIGLITFCLGTIMVLALIIGWHMLVSYCFERSDRHNREARVTVTRSGGTVC